MNTLQPCPNRHRSNLRIHLHVEAFEPSAFHGSEPCGCPRKSIGVREKDYDLATKQLAQLVQLNILHTAETIKDTSGTGNSESVNTAATLPLVAAGTGGSAATVIDNVLGTETETTTATVNAFSGTGSSGTFTVTGTVTAGADRAYIECGLRVTANSHLYLITRDAFSTLNVSNGGTLAISYTLTWS